MKNEKESHAWENHDEKIIYRHSIDLNIRISNFIHNIEIFLKVSQPV